MRELLTIALLLTGACTVHRRGLVSSEGDRVLLTTATGRRLCLLTPADAAPIRKLQGCQVEVEGPKVGCKLIVHDWRVIDGGDGAMPYVGVLWRYGGRWMMLDRDSGSRVFFAIDEGDPLTRLQGHVVMVTGFVTGPSIVQPVSWRDLGRPMSDGR